MARFHRQLLRALAARSLRQLAAAQEAATGHPVAAPQLLQHQQQQPQSCQAARHFTQLWPAQLRQARGPCLEQPCRWRPPCRGYAAAPARAVADTVADVAQRKLADIERRYAGLQEKLEGLPPGSDAYQRLSKEAGALAPLVEGFQQLQQQQRDADGLRDVMLSEDDKELQDLAREELDQVTQQIEALRQWLLLALLPRGQSDESNVMLEVRSSVGGEWAGGFAADLLDMYRKYAAAQGWRFEVVESKATDLGGIKSATAFVSGPGAYGQLRWESGVHRATMVPPNDKGGRMQTGTAVVIALPEASEVEVRINEADLRIETCRASGKGGQHVNTTDSAVRIVHLPSGIVVTCQNERSQGQNKMQALRVLRAKLLEQEASRQAASLSSQRRAVAGLANANERIRSYNYQDGRVSDHRVGVNVQIDVPRFMSDAGRLDELIDAVKLQHQQQLLQEMLEEDADATA